MGEWDAECYAALQRGLHGLSESWSFCVCEGPQFTITCASPGFERLTLFPRAQAVGAGCWALLQGGSGEEIRRLWAEVQERGRCEATAELVARDGTRYLGRVVCLRLGARVLVLQHRCASSSASACAERPAEPTPAVLAELAAFLGEPGESEAEPGTPRPRTSLEARERPGQEDMLAEPDLAELEAASEASWPDTGSECQYPLRGRPKVVVLAFRHTTGPNFQRMLLAQKALAACVEPRRVERGPCVFLTDPAMHTAAFAKVQALQLPPRHVVVEQALVPAIEQACESLREQRGHRPRTARVSKQYLLAL